MNISVLRDVSTSSWWKGAVVGKGKKILFLVVLLEWLIRENKDHQNHNIKHLSFKFNWEKIVFLFWLITKWKIFCVNHHHKAHVYQPNIFPHNQQQCGQKNNNEKRYKYLNLGTKQENMKNI